MFLICRDVICSPRNFFLLISYFHYCDLQGRNTFAANLVTHESCCLTWKVVFQCFTNDRLPDRLRAEFCSLVEGTHFITHVTCFSEMSVRLRQHYSFHMQNIRCFIARCHSDLCIISFLSLFIIISVVFFRQLFREGSNIDSPPPHHRNLSLSSIVIALLVCLHHTHSSIVPNPTCFSSPPSFEYSSQPYLFLFTTLIRV